MDSVQTKVEALLGRMTLEEKVAQMIQVPYAMVGRDEALKWAQRGAGSFLHVLGDDAREVQQAALHSRLGIPVLFGIDAIHGHGLNDHATIFPTQLAAACSWNTAVVREMGRVTAREVASDGLHWTFSPVLCLGRDTRWGRVDETFGEDPFLAGTLGAAIIEGYQGDDLTTDDSILACAKHYIGYGEATGARDAVDTSITWRRLRETFLPPFAMAVKAGCATFMTAYGSIDGTPFTASRKALTDILRGELGFDGFVVTDWDNAQNLVSRQFVCEDLKEASRVTAQAGNDMIMTSLGFYDAAIEAVRRGSLEEKLIDDAVRHILTVKFRMGLFEHPEKKGVPGCIGCDAHHQSALNAARESVTLLRNGGVLPLDPKAIKKIAVIGPNADDVRAQYGDWTYFTHPLPDPLHTPVRPYVTVLEGIQAIAKAYGFEAAYAKGCGILASDADDLPGAVETAKDCDAVVLVLGDNFDQNGETKDRADLALSGRQMELFRALKALNRPLITVLLSGKPLCVGEAAEGSDAFVCAFNGGQFGGQAVAEALFGLISPKGRLPISFPVHSGQVPVHYSSLPGWHGGKYMDMPEAPLFAFGEGLGYTTFRYDDLAFDADALKACVTVTNTGETAGCETVQVYFRDCVSRVITPVKRLIAFEQVDLAPGERMTLTFRFDRKDFSYVNPEEETVTDPGEFVLMVGHSSKDEDLLSCRFTL